MRTLNVLRHLCADPESLVSYDRGEIPSFADIKRHLFLLSRSLNPDLPDHYYRRAQECDLSDIKTTSGILTTGIFQLADQHLHLIGNRVFVKPDNSSDWQELLTLCSPLVLVSALLRKKYVSRQKNRQTLMEFIRSYIAPNVRHASLSSIKERVLEELEEKNRIYDLHIHLNGTTETDNVWQDFLMSPENVYRLFQNSWDQESSREKVREQAAQIEIGFTPKVLYKRLRIAALIRRLMVHRLFREISPALEKLEKYSLGSLLTQDLSIVADISSWRQHPLQRVLVGGEGGNLTATCLEALLLILVMDEIEMTGDESLANALHYYLLVLGFVNRFLVQQLPQKGFDQFQKITLNNLRQKPEEAYKRRFLQLSGNDKNKPSGHNIEGRFSPADTISKNLALILRIKKGWYEVRRERPNDKANMALVAHFIKKMDNENLDRPWLPLLIRHRKLRKDIWSKAHALQRSRFHLHSLQRGAQVDGIDTASNELEAPPEVFAPVYRYLRRTGIGHFTYHAGEDFHHLIGGLRVMWESVDFLGLQRGDRIGHGTAAGINPRLWSDAIGTEFYISQGEWLDDLVFSHFLITEKEPALTGLLPSISNEIERLSIEVYNRPVCVSSLVAAWRLRKCCPFHMLYSRECAMSSSVWSEHEWLFCRQQKCEKESIELLKLYHTASFRRKYHKKIKIKTIAILGPDELEALQDIVLSILHEKEIVLECLLTSNVRISFYRDYKDHHLWRWLGLEEGAEGKCYPPVVLGSDDPGIFATNIGNEYRYVYRQLIDTRKLSYSKARDMIENLCRNAETYYFGSALQPGRQEAVR